ncbi:PRTRC system ThiF family protein [Mucilaginibacter sp. KACC 22773]|uniref:PRTRC system ThiF family protein n=1 Tax=Mucilaginibacter sp. KACC 22773 TaxID=3025671 RepID=UPI0023665546|nr:PRTRC system ThiF family protein [Mucilaginibacter sp. KACC 22773]WDF77137.1 PRTRC system ThiF family protein [Mucilaginibacter sp. KACC 22773]
MKTLTPIHITDNYLINPTNPITVNIIGCGGTGSQMLTNLARMQQAMLALNHPGFMVYAYDDDTVSEANLGRQLFAEAELGLSKSVVLVNRINRFFGTNWKAVTRRYDADYVESQSNEGKANLFISCVDNAVSRFEIAAMLQEFSSYNTYERNRPLYWMDLGNSKDTGQVILSTIGKHKQPESKKYAPVGNLPFVTETFKDLLATADATDDTPSCSLAEALTKQDLFINSALATMGSSLLWQLFREGILFNCGFFMNLKDFRTTPIKITSPVIKNLNGEQQSQAA